jgi:hypothetical protein
MEKQDDHDINARILQFQAEEKNYPHSHRFRERVIVGQKENQSKC